MATFVSDSFTDTAGTGITAHTGETGATWSALGTFGTALVINSGGNRVRADANANLGALASGTPATAEYDVSADVYIASDVGAGGVVGRGTDASNFYAARRNGASGQWDLIVQAAGAFTLIGGFTAAVTAGNTYRLKLEVRDAAKKVYVDGVEVFSTPNNAVTAAGKAGLQTSPDTGVSLDTASYQFDNFLAADPPSTTFTLSGSGSVPAPTGSGTGLTVAQPSYTLSGTGTSPAPSGSGSGLAVSQPTYTLSGTGSSPAPTGSGTGITFTQPSYTLSGSGSVPAPTGAGTGLTVTQPSYVLSGSGSVPAPSGSGVGLAFTQPSSTLSGAGTVAAPTGSGGGLVVTQPTSTLSGTGSIPVPSGSGSGLTFTQPTYTLSGSGDSPAPTGTPAILGTWPNVADNAIRDALRGSTAIQALTEWFVDDEGNETYGVFEEIVPDGADVPHVVITPVSDGRALSLGQMASGAIQRVSYLLRATARTRTAAGDLIAAVDSELDFAQLTVSGYALVALYRQGAGQRYADGDGFNNATFYYEMVAQKL